MAKSAFGALIAETFATYEEAQARARLDDEHEEARMEFAGAYEAMVAGVGSEAAAARAADRVIAAEAALDEWWGGSDEWR